MNTGNRWFYKAKQLIYYICSKSWLCGFEDSQPTTYTEEFAGLCVRLLFSFRN